MHTCRASFDHRFHQLKDIQWTTKTSLGIGHNGSKPVGMTLALCHLDLIRSLQSLVNAAHDMRNAIGGVETLVRVHVPGKISVGGNLPAAQINGLQASLYLLYSLVTC